MRYTPSFGTALARLGLLIPICISGQALVAIDLSPAPQSEVFWTLDGDVGAYCSGHLQEALQHCPTPQASSRVSRKKWNAKKTAKKKEPSVENAPILCQGSAVYAGEHAQQSANAVVGGMHKTTICHTPASCQDPIPGLAGAGSDDEGIPLGGDPRQHSSLTDRQIAARSQETIAAMEPDQKLRHVPELLCKPCHLNPKCGTEPHQGQHDQLFSDSQEVVHDSAWNGLIPSFANEGCDRFSRDIAHHEGRLVADQDCSSPHRHLAHDPQFDQSIPNFACESQRRIQKHARSETTFSIRDDHNPTFTEIAHSPSFDQAIPQFVVESRNARQTPNSGASDSDFTLMASVVSHAEIAHSAEFSEDIPAFVLEPCDRSGCVQNMTMAWHPNDASSVSSSEVGHNVHYDQQVPTFARESCDEMGSHAGTCMAGNFSEYPPSLAFEAAHHCSAPQDIPAFASNGGCTPCITPSPEEPITIRERSSTFSVERPHQATIRQDVPYLAQESCVTSPSSWRDQSISYAVQEHVRHTELAHAPASFEQQIPSYAATGRDDSASLYPADISASRTQQGFTHPQAEVAHQSCQRGDVPSFACSSGSDSAGYNHIDNVASERKAFSQRAVDACHASRTENRMVPTWVQESCQTTSGKEGQRRNTEATTAMLVERGTMHKPSFDMQVPHFAADGQEGATTLVRSQCTAGHLAQGPCEPVSEAVHRAGSDYQVPELACTSCSDTNRGLVALQPATPQKGQSTSTTTISHQAKSEHEIPRFVQESCVASQGCTELPGAISKKAIALNAEDYDRAQQRAAVLAKVAYHPVFAGLAPQALYEEVESAGTPLATAQDYAHRSTFINSIPLLAHSDNSTDAGEDSGPSRGSHNKYLTNSSSILKTDLEESSVPLLLDQADQLYAPGQSLTQGNADSRQATSRPVFSHDVRDAWVPEMLTERCDPSVAAQPHTRTVNSDQATMNNAFQRMDVASAWVPEMLTECCEDGITAMPRGHQGCVQQSYASSGDAHIGSDLHEAPVPGLLTDSCPENATAQPLYVQNSSENYASGKRDDKKAALEGWVPELLRDTGERTANAQPLAHQKSSDGHSTTSNTEIVRSGHIQNSVPELLRDTCEPAANAQRLTHQRSTDGHPTTGNANMLRSEPVERWVPELLNECCDQNTHGQAQIHQGSAQEHFATSDNRIHRSDLTQAWVPELVREGCDEKAHAQNQVLKNLTGDRYATSTAEIVRTDLAKNHIPELVKEGECALNAHAQNQVLQKSSEDRFATSSSEISQSELVRNWVPELLGECCEGSAATLTATPRRAAHTEEGANLSHYSPIDHGDFELFADQSVISDPSIEQSAPETAKGLALCHADLPHLAALMKTIRSPQKAASVSAEDEPARELESPIQEEEFFVEAVLNEPARETESPILEEEEPFVEMASAVSDEEGMDAVQFRLEELLAHLRILQDRQQLERERETALQLHTSQLLPFTAGMAALEDSPPRDQLFRSDTAETRIGPSTYTAPLVWDAVEGQAAVTCAADPAAVCSPPTLSKSWEQFQESAPTYQAPYVAPQADEVWNTLALAPAPLLQSSSLSNPRFSKQTPLAGKGQRPGDSLAIEWLRLQPSSKPAPEVVLQQLQPQAESRWGSVQEVVSTPAASDEAIDPSAQPESSVGNSPWNSWETPSTIVTQIQGTAFAPAEQRKSMGADQALTLWNQWTVTDSPSEENLWAAWEDSEPMPTDEPLAVLPEEPENEPVAVLSEGLENEPLEETSDESDTVLADVPESLFEVKVEQPETVVDEGPEDLLAWEDYRPAMRETSSTQASSDITGPYTTRCLGSFDHLTVHEQNAIDLEQIPCNPSHDIDRGQGFAGRGITPQADRLQAERTSLFATPTELNTPPPVSPYLGSGSQELLDAIALMRQEEEEAALHTVYPLHAPNELGGREPLTQAGPRFPAPKAPLADKVPGLYSNEENWEARVENLPSRSGIIQVPPGINKNTAARIQFQPTAMEEEPYTPPAPTPIPKVNFRPAGASTLCEDDSFCYTGVSRVTETLSPPREQNNVGPKKKVRRVRKRGETAQSSGQTAFKIQVKPQSDAVQEPAKSDSTGARSSRGPLSMLRKVLSFFISDAYASEGSSTSNGFNYVGVPVFDDQEDVDDEDWWEEPVEPVASLPDDNSGLVVGARNPLASADESHTGYSEAKPVAGIDQGYKPYALGVTRHGHLWGPLPEASTEETRTWAIAEPFTSTVLTPPEPDHRDFEAEDQPYADFHPPVQKKNYDWNVGVDDLDDAESSDDSLAYDDEWDKWKTELQQSEEYDDDDEEEYEYEEEDDEWDEEEDPLAEHWEAWKAELSRPVAHVTVDVLPEVHQPAADAPPEAVAEAASVPAPLLDPLTPSRDLNPNRTLAQESLSPKLMQPETQETPPAAPLPPPPATKGFTMNFPNVNIKEFIRFVSRETEKNFIYNEDELDFNVTIVSAEPTSLENIIAALLQELRIHGFSLIDQGNTLIIHRSGANSPAKMWADETHVDEADIVTRVFRLKNVPLSEMAPVVKQMLSDKALVQVLPESRSLIVTDLAENITRLSSLITSLDVPSKTYELGQYVAINNFVENLIPLAEQILRPLAGNDSLTFVPHLATNSVFIIAPPVLVKRAISVMEHLDHLEGQTQILTLDRLVPSDSSAAVARQKRESTSGTSTTTIKQPIGRVRRKPFDLSPENLLRSEAGRLDIESEVNPNEDIHANLREREVPDSYGQRIRVPVRPVEKTPDQIAVEELENTKFYIHRLQYRKGDQLVDALSRIAESLRYNEKANIDLINAITSTQWIESSNSIMVTGTQLALDRVKQLILEIDVPLRQILLEMLVIETTVADSLHFSVDWASDFADDHAAGAQAWQSEASGSGLLKLPAATTTVGQLTIPTLGQQGFQLGVIGRRILLGNMYFSSLGLLVNALHGVTDVDIKLNPKIVVEDNTPAELFVGQNTAFLSQAITNQLGNVIANNVEFRDVGTRLSVTPLIGNGDMITLVIALEDSKDVSGTSGSSGGIGPSGNTINPGPTTSTTRTTTKIHVPNKFFVILSGMIREEKLTVQQNLPCLGGIPIIAGFAKSKRDTIAKRNLMVFIRPQIIETEWEYDEVTRRQQNIYKMNSEDKQPPWQYEVNQALEFFHLPRFNDKECCVPDVNDDNCSCCQFWADPLWDW